MDKNLVYKIKFWNFELITILPSTPSPFSVPAVTAFAVSPSATCCTVAVPWLGSPREPQFLPEASRHRHASPSICAHTEVRHRTTTTTTCRVGLPAPRSSALSPPFLLLRKQALSLSLYSPPCYKRQAGPPTASRAAVARHERRRPRPPRGAPPLSSLDPSHPRERVPLGSLILTSLLTAAPTLRSAASTVNSRRRPPAPVEPPPRTSSPRTKDTQRCGSVPSTFSPT